MFDIDNALQHWDAMQEVDIDEQNHGEDYTPEESRKADERGHLIAKELGEVMRAGFDPGMLK